VPSLATAEGKKQLVAVIDAYRASEQCWHNPLIDVRQLGLQIERWLSMTVLRWAFGLRCESSKHVIRNPSRPWRHKGRHV
jgi:hypothetical protein